MIVACSACGTDFNAQNAGLDAGNGGPGGSAGSGGLPCDVQSVLSDHCTSCHGHPPSNGAPISLVTYDDLLAPATGGVPAAQRALLRMTSTASPMPPAPAPAVPAAQIATFQAWITAGMPPGTCGTNDPFAAAPTCTSGTYWSGASDGSSTMNPGDTCVSCHALSGGEAPPLTAGGTVYKTGHEPTDCNGATGASIVITDASGASYTLAVNSAGNFMTTAALRFPIHAKVVSGGNERVMASAQNSGDCDSCHSQSGTNGAPGRIALP